MEMGFNLYCFVDFNEFIFVLNLFLKLYSCNLLCFN